MTNIKLLVRYISIKNKTNTIILTIKNNRNNFIINVLPSNLPYHLYRYIQKTKLTDKLNKKLIVKANKCDL